MNRRRLASLAASIALALPVRAQDADPFPPAAPDSVGMAAQALAKLADVVRGFVAADDVVGAELLVIRNDKTVLDECFGWKDREDKVAMVPGTIFCVRSMTKPVAGTAVEMLIEEKKLALLDRASKYLPSFDNDKSREITIEELFHHTSGLPLSSLLSHRLDTLTSIREVADLAGAHGPDFAPGDHLSYSDDGADTLGALVAIASGKKLEDFLAERLFGPLGMRDTIAFVAADHPLRPRIASNYMGGPKNWTRYWSPKDPPIFPFLLASQALYCTPKDYARFLSLWKSRGSWNGKRLLASKTTKRALALGTPMNFPCGFDGVELDYGELWMLYADQQKKDELYAFGHDGSDGTFAYVFPKLDLMVLYFTQSRNTQTGFPFEQALQREIVDPMLHVDRKPAAAYGESELDALAGWYWDPDREDVMAIARKGSGLEIELPATAALELKASSTRDHWILAISPDQAFDAVRADDGSVTAWIGRNGKDEQRYPRWKGDPSLPSVDDVMALRKRAVDWEKLDSVGAVRVHGKLEMPALKTTGTFTSTSRGLDHYRLDVVTTQATAHVVVDGASAWTSNTMLSGGKPTHADEATYARLRYATPLHVVADWRPMFRELRVIARIKVGEAEAIEVRATPEQGRARTLLVDAKTGLLLGEKVIQSEAGLGELGSSIHYDDWREVGAIRLPFHNTVDHPTPLLGTYETHWDAVETNVDLTPDFFAMPKSD